MRIWIKNQDFALSDSTTREVETSLPLLGINPHATAARDGDAQLETSLPLLGINPHATAARDGDSTTRDICAAIRH